MPNDDIFQELLDDRARVLLARLAGVRDLDPELMLAVSYHVHPDPDDGTAETTSAVVRVLPRRLAFHEHRGVLPFLARAEFWVDRPGDEVFVVAVRGGRASVGVWSSHA